CPTGRPHPRRPEPHLPRRGPRISLQVPGRGRGRGERLSGQRVRGEEVDTITTSSEGGVLFAEIVAPPMNLLGPELVRDLVKLIRHAEGDEAVKVVVFRSGDPDY